MPNSNTSSASKATSGEIGTTRILKEDFRNIPASPLGPSAFGAVPEHINRSRVDMSDEPELPASYKQRMVALQKDGTVAPPTPPKEQNRDAGRSSPNSTPSRDRDTGFTNASNPSAQQDSSVGNERSIYDYPPMTPVTIADAHFREGDEGIPELPPLPPSAIPSNIRPATSHGASTFSYRPDVSPSAVRTQPLMDLTREREPPSSFMQRLGGSRRNDFSHRNYGTRPGTSSSRLQTAYDRPDASFGDGENVDRTHDDMLYSSIHRADLSSWAEWPNPNANVLESSDISNLPSWKDVQEGAPTSLPNGLAQMEVEYGLKRLLNIQVFEMCELSFFLVLGRNI